jgi:hypothetical protein
MAKVTITIEDTPNGKVKIVAEPSFETMANMIVSGETMTSAHGYAMTCIKAVRQESKNADPTTLIKLPRLGR